VNAYALPSGDQPRQMSDEDLAALYRCAEALPGPIPCRRRNRRSWSRTGARIDQGGPGVKGDCRCCTLYRQLDAADKAFFDAKATGRQPKTWLWKACVDDGWDVSESAFRVHLARHHARRRR
jgi:hypothetical protein